MKQEEKYTIELQWRSLQANLKKRFGKAPDLHTVLFLIGLQEIRSSQKEFSKEQKEELIHVGACKLLSKKGYFQLVAYDHEGWPHFEPVKSVPDQDKDLQEMLLKQSAIQYFED